MSLNRTSEFQNLDEHAVFTDHAIGNKVRNRRIESGLSLEAVAHVLGCDVTHLEAAENSIASFTPAQIVNLCPILQAVPSWLFSNLGETRSLIMKAAHAMQEARPILAAVLRAWSESGFERQG